MTNENPNSLDIFGIKPVADSLNIIVKGTVEGAQAFLSRICLPAADEFGELLRDKVHGWRTSNLVSVANKAEQKLITSPDNESRKAHPRLLAQVIENSSWVDAEEVQEMWAGLLASSCTIDGKDESNLIFINLLSQLTTSQVRILKYGCENAVKLIGEAGWVSADELTVSIKQLQEISGVEDFHRLDRELDHLRALDLLNSEGGFDFNSTNAGLSPTALAIHLYIRGQGSLQSPTEFFDLKISVK